MIRWIMDIQFQFQPSFPKLSTFPVGDLTLSKTIIVTRMMAELMAQNDNFLQIENDKNGEKNDNCSNIVCYLNDGRAHDLKW